MARHSARGVPQKNGVFGASLALFWSQNETTTWMLGQFTGAFMVNLTLPAPARYFLLDKGIYEVAPGLIPWGIPEVGVGLFGIQVFFIEGCGIRQQPGEREPLLSATKTKSTRSQACKSIERSSQLPLNWLRPGPAES
jgi:hypothetical protein